MDTWTASDLTSLGDFSSLGSGSGDYSTRAGEILSVTGFRSRAAFFGEDFLWCDGDVLGLRLGDGDFDESD